MSRIFFRLLPASLVICCLLAACAGKPQPAVQTPRRPQITRPVVPTDTGMGDPSVNSPAVSTPAQIQAASPNPAAESLVEKGVQRLNGGDIASAEWHIEEAIRLAPNYGPAYYWMAHIKYQARHFSQAQSFIDKAQLLSFPGSAWSERIEALRGLIFGASP